ncbi:hypothetical protein [Enterococcus malodoratus]|uniref:hypothetical protein n=1 Tax=Enterococcus malodoratus TaxID=71451 RepID=UPI0039AF395F
MFPDIEMAEIMQNQLAFYKTFYDELIASEHFDVAKILETVKNAEQLSGYDSGGNEVS